jgi:hypothetical protein
MVHIPDPKNVSAPPFLVAVRYLTAAELAKLWNIPKTWIYECTRARCTDPIPRQYFGKYVRFQPDSPEMQDWLSRQRGFERANTGRAKKKNSKQEKGRAQRKGEAA